MASNCAGVPNNYKRWRNVTKNSIFGKERSIATFWWCRWTMMKTNTDATSKRTLLWTDASLQPFRTSPALKWSGHNGTTTNSMTSYLKNSSENTTNAPSSKNSQRRLPTSSPKTTQQMSSRTAKISQQGRSSFILQKRCSIGWFTALETTSYQLRCGVISRISGWTWTRCWSWHSWRENMFVNSGTSGRAWLNSSRCTQSSAIITSRRK